MKMLNISSSLKLPLEFITQTQAILAMKRVGKSYTASVEAEELLKAKQQVVVIDMTGAWWGLRSNAAGDGPGFPITIFGGDHGDLPLEKTAGETLAEAIVSERFNAILDLSLLRKGEALVFLVAFLETLYRKNRQPMHLFCDEADYYAPQKPYGEEIKTLGAMNDIVLRGGIKGIGCTLITQRPTRINKDVLTQCGILMCLRMSHPRDLEPIEEWVSEHASGGLPAEMRKSLPSMPKGTAWIWSTGWPTEAGIFKQIKIRQRHTFNSSATPEIGKSLKGPKVMATVDLKKLGERIAATVEQVKSNDPTELRKRIKELEGKLAKPIVARSVPIPAPREIETIDREKLQTAMRGEVERVIEGQIKPRVAKFLRSHVDLTLEALTNETEIWEFGFVSDKGLRELDKAVVKVIESRPALPVTLAESSAIATLRALPRATTGETNKLRSGALRALAVLSQYHPKALKKGTLRAQTGIKSRNTFSSYMSALNTQGFISQEGELISITESGLAQCGDLPAAPRTTEDVVKIWEGRFRAGAFVALKILIALRGSSITKSDLQERSGIKSANTFSSYLSALNTAQLIVFPSKGIVAANKETLFL